MRRFTLPKLYAIIDTQLIGRLNLGIVDCAAMAMRGGAKLVQYRHKGEFTRRQWEECCYIAELAHGSAKCTFIVNDRVDIAIMSGADGVHLGQNDLPPNVVREMTGPEMIIGVSTHNPAQTKAADAMPVDYIAIGPVYATVTKENPDPVVGLNGVSAARRATKKPLVAIGGITRDNAMQVIGAGADSVAVVRDLYTELAVQQNTQDFLALL
jgi:thiamine-phosphate pyrophosphorylase